MTAPPSAAVDPAWFPNPVQAALEDGRLGPPHLLPLAVDLEALVASNVDSAHLMRSRHGRGRLGEFYALVAEAEEEALRLLAPLLAATRGAWACPTTPGTDPQAQAYPAYVAHVAQTGEEEDYAWAFARLCGPSTATYARLAATLRRTCGFGDAEVAHFDYYGQPDDGLVEAVLARIGDLDPGARRRVDATADRLAQLEELFWQRTAAACIRSTEKERS